MIALLAALALIVAGGALLLKGADWFVDGASDSARILGVSALVIGVIVAGFEPEEILTAAIASGRGAPALALGDVIGTNITVVTLALGLSAALAPISVTPAILRQIPAWLVAALAAVAALALGTVSRPVGIGLLAIFAGTMNRGGRR